MFGGLGAFIASEVSAAVRRNVIVYGLFCLALLLLLCACGYALSALHSMLALQYGSVAASLWIAGGLLLAALLAIGGALFVKNRRRPRPYATAALATAPAAAKLLGPRLNWRTALIGGVVVLGALLGRQFFNGGADKEEG